MKLLRNAWASLERHFGRRATVAMVVALTAPLLIGMTGLAVDVGYWYQQQERLQSAADLAAVATANAAKTYGYLQTTGNTPASFVASGGPGQYFAAQAVNMATNGLLSSGNVTVGSTTGTETDGKSYSGFTATATVPRLGFFSPVGIYASQGVVSGNQSAGAMAIIVQVPVKLCVDVKGGPLTAQGDNGISAPSNCVIQDSDKTAKSVSQTSTASIEAAGGVLTAASSVGKSGVGAGIGATVTTNATMATNPLDSMAEPSSWAWPTMPLLPWSPPALTLNTTNCAGSVCTTNCPSTNCSMGVYSAGGAYSGYTLNSTGGALDVTGGYTNSGTLTMTGTSTSSTYFGGTGISVISNTPTGYAITLGFESNTTASAGQFYFNGGLNDSPSGGDAQATFSSGYYQFGAYNGGDAINFDDVDGTLSINKGGAGGAPGSGGVSFFANGAITLLGDGSIVFGPGIYYIENGALSLGNTTTLTGSNVTLVFENGGSFDIATSHVTLTAATTNCVPYSSFGSTNTTTYPYDGTDGEPICNVAIYQDVNDTATDDLGVGASSLTVGGAIYAPGATINTPSTTNITINATGVPALTVYSMSLATSTLTINQSGTSDGAYIVSAPLLVQ